jgi:AcrR family transcriptional regulator
MMAAEPLTREQILAAAKEALRRYGPAKTTVVDVAQALGVSHGAVYRHFPTKAALRGAVVRSGLEVRRRAVGGHRRGDGPAVDRLHRWLLALIDFKHGYAREDAELFETYAMIDKDAPEVVREHIEALTVQLDRILADGVEAGEFRASALGSGWRSGTPRPASTTRPPRRVGRPEDRGRVRGGLGADPARARGR